MGTALWGWGVREEAEPRQEATETPPGAPEGPAWWRLLGFFQPQPCLPALPASPCSENQTLNLGKAALLHDRAAWAVGPGMYVGSGPAPASRLWNLDGRVKLWCRGAPATLSFDFARLPPSGLAIQLSNPFRDRLLHNNYIHTRLAVCSLVSYEAQQLNEP